MTSSLHPTPLALFLPSQAANLVLKSLCSTGHSSEGFLQNKAHAHPRLILAVLLQPPPIVANSTPLLIRRPLPLELRAKYPLPRAAGNEEEEPQNQGGAGARGMCFRFKSKPPQRLEREGTHQSAASKVAWLMWEVWRLET